VVALLARMIAAHERLLTNQVERARQASSSSGAALRWFVVFVGKRPPERLTPGVSRKSARAIGSPFTLRPARPSAD
jgi:hypothetical protein